MSDLKYKSVEQLQTEAQETKKHIANLESRLNGQRQRLLWIERYIYEKTPQELTVEEIERKLGHRIIIK